MAKIRIRLTSRAKREAIEGWRGNALLVRVTAPPFDGRANDALLRLLAEVLHLPLRDVTLVAGATSRDKTVEVNGLDQEVVRARLDIG